MIKIASSSLLHFGLQEVLNRLQTRLAEAEAAEAARLQPEKEEVPKTTMVQEGLVIDEWVRCTLYV